MDTRRDFVRKMIGGGVVFSHLHANDYPALPPAGKQDGTVHAGPYTIDNPYADVIWNKVKYIPSATHVHVESQEKFDKIYHKFGLRHMPKGIRLLFSVAGDLADLVKDETATAQSDSKTQSRFFSRLAAQLWLLGATRHQAS